MTATMSSSASFTLSVVIPVYDERYLIRELLERVRAVDLPDLAGMEIVVVDDGSTDGTRDILRELSGRWPEVRLILHPENRGKGAAVRTGIEAAGGNLIIIQDADLEYDPRDYGRMIRPFLEDGADVVYGSRFLAADRRRVLYFRHALGNRLITLVSNWFTDLNLTDVETCYKMFRAPLLKSIPLRSDDFAMEPELTAKVAKRRCRVFEVPVSYVGRTYGEGKKIGWRDGFKALFAILRFHFVDDLYKEDEYGSRILHELEQVPRFNRWMADTVRPWVGDRVLEIGAGIGNITSQLLPRDRYLASDLNPHYVHYLRNFALGKPYLQVAKIDLDQSDDFAGLEEGFDTVVCLNVLEHVPDPDEALSNMAAVLEPGGRLVLYVPGDQRLYSPLDEVLGHRCRYDRTMLTRELTAAGLEVEEMFGFNRSSVPGWWLNGKVFGRRHLSRLQLKLFNLVLPLVRRLDHLLPWPGLGLVAVARKPSRGR
jgi:glycosyltransferase involved in cell wall biosynthesis